LPANPFTGGRLEIRVAEENRLCQPVIETPSIVSPRYRAITKKELWPQRQLRSVFAAWPEQRCRNVMGGRAGLRGSGIAGAKSTARQCPRATDCRQQRREPSLVSLENWSGR